MPQSHVHQSELAGPYRMMQPPTHVGFQLTKWYLDCVSEDGEAVIAYWARAAWRGLAVGYAGLLQRSASGEVASSFTLRPGAEPCQEGDTIRWRCDALGLCGEWRCRVAAAGRELFRAGAGAIDWECAAPAAEVEMKLARGTLSGLGYSERLELTIAPWKLPIRELRWGRWIGPTSNVVWIDWRGEHPLTLILLGGEQVHGEVLDHEVRIAEGPRLVVSDNRVLRSGDLGATVLDSIPILRSALPEAILHTHEEKWIGRGVLTGADGVTEEGWAIHEVVRFSREGA